MNIDISKRAEKEKLGLYIKSF